MKEYSAGDDVRFIDWNVSARYATPFSKVFEEERELVVMLLIDTSASTLFGTVGRRKKDLMIEMAATLAFSAISNNDKVGVIFFSQKMEKYIPPKKGREHALYIVRELLTLEPKNTGTNIDEAIKYFNNTTRQKSIAFILSDFIDTGYDNDLKVIGKRHDVIGLKAVSYTHLDVYKRQELVRQVYIDEKVENYILDIVFATRFPENYNLQKLKPIIGFGGSPRASINLRCV